MIAERSVQEVRARADCLAEAQRHTQMKRAGRQWKGLSPFASEKTPSFYVNPDKNVWFCYSSGKGGDVISLVMLCEGMEFGEAVENLGERHHIRVERVESAQAGLVRGLRQGVRRAQEVAWSLWREQWGKCPGVREWWTGARGFSLETAEAWGLCFAPAEDGGELAKRLGKELPPEVVDACGLLTEARPGYARRSRLRGRAVLPIRGAGGVILGFTGRVLAGELGPVANDPLKEAKYVNSPETCLFVKGEVLFGLEEARQIKAEEGKRGGGEEEIWVVEGQLDAVRCQCHGLPAVATGGTAVTEGQMRKARRQAARLVLWMDGDSAGQKSIERILPLALAEGFEVRIVGAAAKDADEWLRKGGAVPDPKAGLGPMAWLVERVKERAGWGTMSRAAAFEELAVVAECAPAESARVALREEAARLLGLGGPRHHKAEEGKRGKGEEGLNQESRIKNQESSWEFAVLVALAAEPGRGRAWAERVPAEWSRGETAAGALLGKALGRIECGEPWALLTEVAESEAEARVAAEAEATGAVLGVEEARELAEGAVRKRGRSARLALMN